MCTGDIYNNVRSLKEKTQTRMDNFMNVAMANRQNNIRKVLNLVHKGEQLDDYTLADYHTALQDNYVDFTFAMVRTSDEVDDECNSYAYSALESRASLNYKIVHKKRIASDEKEDYHNYFN